MQLSPGDGTADIVQIAAGQSGRRTSSRLLADRAVTKIFHFARFDIAVLEQTFGVMAAAGLLHQDRLAADAHLYRPPRPEGPVKELLDIELSKQQQSSDWAAET